MVNVMKALIIFTLAFCAAVVFGCGTMVLIEDNPTRTAILFQRDYHQVVEVTDTSPDGLTLAWNQGLEQVFIALEEDLRKINFGANHQKPASRR